MPLEAAIRKKNREALVDAEVKARKDIGDAEVMAAQKIGLSEAAAKRLLIDAQERAKAKLEADEREFRTEFYTKLGAIDVKLEKLASDVGAIREYVARKDEQIIALGSRVKDTEETVKTYNWKIISGLLIAVVSLLGVIFSMYVK